MTSLHAQLLDALARAADLAEAIDRAELGPDSARLVVVVRVALGAAEVHAERMRVAGEAA